MRLTWITRLCNTSDNSILKPSLLPDWVKIKIQQQKRINSWRKGYMKGQPDIMIMNYHYQYFGLCIEFKSPSNNYRISKAKLEMRERYHQNNYRFLISNDYDNIIAYLNKHMSGVRISCKYCSNAFYNKQTYKSHLQSFHKINI